MKTSTVLKRALRLLDGGRRWIKGELDGKKPGVRGACYCAEGAISAADTGAPSQWMYAMRAMHVALGRNTKALWVWNDAPHRRWSHVEAAFKRAIKLAEKEERR